MQMMRLKLRLHCYFWTPLYRNFAGKYTQLLLSIAQPWS
ncbi:hypothetical protein OIU77_031128 [Salix suchowensis]|uniref:Uncharacterized protein n=1 Tax=Salix suchowensis TaxID=1278906 RepID=A0ABQ9BER0_9ROSI|nr:hypothetical protein OIU77_031128 [Salix suchowensis]